MQRAVDEFGFFLDSKDANPVVNSKQKIRESDWLQYLQTGNWNQTQLKKMCRLGIPDSLRAQVWIKLAGADSKRKDGLYKAHLEKSVSELDQVTKNVINMDLSRTFPNHIMFSDPKGAGVVNLRSVLNAYAVYNPSVGYCQGMGMVVGMMLMRMPPEDAFYLLVAIVDGYMTDYYTPDLSQLRQDGLVFDYLLHKHSKKVAKRLDQLGIDPLIYLTQWFMPIYAISLPWRAVLRVWDMFFCDGVKTLHRIALGIINLSQGANNTSDVLNLLLHIPKNLISPDELIEASLKFRITKVDIEQIRIKMSLQEKVPISQSNSQLLNRSKFNFDTDARGHFLFLRLNNLAKRRDSKKSKSDLLVTAASVKEIVETDYSRLELSDGGLNRADWVVYDKEAGKSVPDLVISKSMDDGLNPKEIENNGLETSEALENYVPSSESNLETQNIVEPSEPDTSILIKKL